MGLGDLGFILMRNIGHIAHMDKGKENIYIYMCVCVRVFVCERVYSQYEGLGNKRLQYIDRKSL